ncbi:MAG: LD-carboxypeptidase, partial [Candidatus Omnitrophica bacterium]|nr:LD-carboxypeptidase [Candidatus Omnitrophota bacterium]
MYKIKPVRPRRLRQGDTVGIVAPAWSFDSDNFKRGVEELKGMGFRVKYENAIFSNYWSMAGYDKERAAQINRMFADKEVKAIFCAKAGYGSIRTIPYLDKKIISNNPKIFIGYSDITILLYYLYKIAGMVVFHGPVVSGEMRPEMNSISRDYLLRAITQPVPMGAIECGSLKMLRPGRASGVLIGGNLSMVISAIGTPYDINTENKILFIEDIGEDLEVIDNYIMHLRLAGKFKKVKGIVFGRMVDCVDDSGNKYTIEDIMDDTLKDINIPI